MARAALASVMASGEVPEAITKATASAKKKMVRVPLKEGRTLHHDGKGRFGAGKVNVRSAPAGTGIIAGGPMRAVFESLGVHDVVTKSVGTSNPYNMIRATFDALQDQTSPKSVAQRRGKKVADLLGVAVLRKSKPKPPPKPSRSNRSWRRSRSSRSVRRSVARNTRRRFWSAWAWARCTAWWKWKTPPKPVAPLPSCRTWWP
jgi:ribosomal protein S5